MILAMILWEELASNTVGTHLYIEIPYFWMNVFTFKAKPRKNLSNWKYLFPFPAQEPLYPNLSSFPFLEALNALDLSLGTGSSLSTLFSVDWQIGRNRSKKCTSDCHWLAHCPSWRSSYLTQRMASYQVSVKLPFLKVMKEFGICTSRGR